MRLRALLAAVLMVLPLAGCGSIGLPGGGVFGAVVTGGGAVPRAEVQPTTSPGVGTVIGGVLGSKTARHLNPTDRGMAADAEYRALEYGQSGTATDWNDPATQAHGSIVPGKPYPQGDEFCRPYTHTIYLDGTPDVLNAVACRKSDGTWRAAT